MLPEITTILTGAAPISEVRGAIPLAVGIFGFSPTKAYLLSVIGNILPVLPLLFFWNYLYEFLIKRLPQTQPFFNWLFERTRTKHGRHFEVYGVIGLAIFVAIPFPLTGVWTATVAAFIFSIPLWKSFFSISLGVVVAGAVVLAATLGFITIF